MLLSNAAAAQQPSKAKRSTGLDGTTVEVVTDYTEKLLETDKIDIKYNTGDSLIYPNIAFTYPFTAHDMPGSFSLEPVPAASMATGHPAMPAGMGYGYLRAGLLLPLAPEADAYLHGLLSKESAVGVYLKHRSYWGKSPLYDRAPVTTEPIPGKVSSAHETTQAGAVFQHLFKQTAIDVKAEYRHQSLLYYGQDTLLLKEAVDSDPMRQTFNIVNADARIYTLADTNRRYTLSLQASFDYLKESAHRPGHKPTSQHMVGLNGALGYKLAPHQTLDVRLHTSAYNRDSLSTRLSAGLLQIMPSYTYRDGPVKASAGLHIESIYNRHGSSYNLYPFLAFHFITCDGLFTPYLEVTGGSTLNNYGRIIAENPYVLPGLDVSNTRTIIEGEAGARGKLGAMLAYRLSAAYAMIDSMYFFVNSTEAINDRQPGNPHALRSNFDVVYDNISTFTVGLELSARFRHIEATLFSNYTGYSMDRQEKPWHKPAIDLGVQARYKWNPYLFTLDVRYRGATPVLLPEAYAAHTASTTACLDLGLTAEYRITERFSVFLEGKNLLNRHYQNYYLYYHPGITAGAGLSYSF
jgi:hypothetical protein